MASTNLKATRQRLPSVTSALTSRRPQLHSYGEPFCDGSFGDLFLENHKADSTTGIMASDAAIPEALTLQFGCRFDVLRKALKRDGQHRAISSVIAFDMLAAEDKDETA
jgi:hypothetical protein